MKWLGALLCFALLMTCAVFGQTGMTGGPSVILTGTVYDINHAVIVFSEVVARSSGGNEYQATTNTEGIYKIELPPDVYKIEANAPGFCPNRVEMFRVRKSTLLQRPLNEKTSIPPWLTLDFVLEVSEGSRPCKQKTMIKKEPQIRKPEIFRSIAE